MKFRAVLSVGLILCAGIAHAQDAVPPAASPLKLDLKLAPGMVRAFTIDVSQKGTMTLPGSGQPMPLDMGLTGFAKLFVDKQNPDGSWTARYKVGGMKMLLNGAPINAPTVSSGMTIKGIIAKNGSFTPTEDASKSPGMMGMGMSPGQTMNNVLGNLMNLPDKPVVVGDTWTNVIPLPFDATGKSTITVDSKVLGIDSLNGDRIVRIQHDTNGPMNMTLTQPMAMNITGTIKGSGVSKVSVNTGSPVDDTSSQHLSLAITGTNPSGNGEQMNIAMEMDVNSHIQATVLKATPKPAAKPAPKGTAKPRARK